MSEYKSVRSYKDLLKKVNKMYKFLDNNTEKAKALFKSSNNAYNMVYLPTGQNKKYTVRGHKYSQDTAKREKYINDSKKHERGVMFVPEAIADDIKNELPTLQQRNKKDKYLRGKPKYDSNEGEEGRIMIPVRVSAKESDNKILLNDINKLYSKIKKGLIENIRNSIDEYNRILNDKNILPDENTDEFNSRRMSVQRLIMEIKNKINEIINKLNGITENMPDTIQINEERIPHDRQTVERRFDEEVKEEVKEEAKEEVKRQRGRPRKIREEVKEEEKRQIGRPRKYGEEATFEERRRLAQSKIRQKRGQIVGRKGRPTGSKNKPLEFNYNQ